MDLPHHETAVNLVSRDLGDWTWRHKIHQMRPKSRHTEDRSDDADVIKQGVPPEGIGVHMPGTVGQGRVLRHGSDTIHRPIQRSRYRTPIHQHAPHRRPRRRATPRPPGACVLTADALAH